MGNGLAPMVEVALAQVKQRGNQFELTTQQIVLLDIELQVDSQCEESGLVISGFYHAHDNLRDNHVDVFSQKIADKVFFYSIWCWVDYPSSKVLFSLRI